MLCAGNNVVCLSVVSVVEERSIQEAGLMPDRLEPLTVTLIICVIVLSAMTLSLTILVCRQRHHHLHVVDDDWSLRTHLTPTSSQLQMSTDERRSMTTERQTTPVDLLSSVYCASNGVSTITSQTYASCQTWVCLKSLEIMRTMRLSTATGACYMHAAAIDSQWRPHVDLIFIRLGTVYQRVTDRQTDGRNCRR